MGIEVSYRRVTPEEFERLQNDPTYASVYFGNDLETDEEIHAYFQALTASDRYLSLDKNWQSLDFLLTGSFLYDIENKSDISLHKVIMGGSETPWEATYGVVRYLTVSEVNEIAEALNHISEDDFKSRLDSLLGSHKSRVYTEPYFRDLYAQLVQFFNLAAQEGDIVLLSFD
jgi:hypothetical protein